MERRNSYDAVRLIAALAVIVSHHFALSGLSSPKVPLFQADLGGVAVAVFFSISGYLIFTSAHRSRDFLQYMTNRILRIAPNLIFSTVLSSAFLLVWFGNWRNLGSHLDYIGHNSLVFLQPVMYRIAGIFTEQPNTSVNGSLWSLQYEFFLYLIIFPIALLPRLAAVLSLTLLFAFVAALPDTRDVLWIGSFGFTGAKFGYFGPFFLAGAAVALLRQFALPIWLRRGLLIAALGIFLSWQMVGGDADGIAFVLATALVMISICETAALSFWSRLGDASYGVYIFGFPVQQVMLMEISGFWTSMVCSLLASTLIGFATWHWLEAPALQCRKTVARALAQGAAGVRRVIG